MFAVAALVGHYESPSSLFERYLTSLQGVWSSNRAEILVRLHLLRLRIVDIVVANCDQRFEALHRRVSLGVLVIVFVLMQDLH